MRSRKVKTTSAPISILVDGKAVEARAGESLASAMVAAGLRIGRHTQSGAPRHVFCGMGVCFDCLAIVKGKGSVRACMTKVEPGMEITTWPSNGMPSLDDLPALAQLPEGDLARESCQLAVIGAGPGGLEAAVAAAEAGVNVTLIDERPDLGGQYFKQPAASIKGGVHEDSRFKGGARLIQRAKRAGVTMLSGATVWRAHRIDDKLELAVMHDGRVFYLEPEQLVIAPGAYDEPLPVPGWTLPGVYTVGGMQNLLRSYGVTPEGPVVVCGNGPLILQLASELVSAGVTVNAVVSASPIDVARLPNFFGIGTNSPSLAVEGMQYLANLATHRVPILSGRVIARVEGGDKPERVIVAKADANGRIDQTTEKSIEASAVAMGYGFLPSSEIARQLGCEYGAPVEGSENDTLWAKRGVDGESSLPGVYVVGEAGGIGGAKIAACQGRLAGLRIAEELTDKPAGRPRIARIIRELARHMAFQSHLNKAFSAAIKPLLNAPDETLVCRCEEVSLGDLKQVIRDGAKDIGSIKRLTRAGMGRCQGRYCQKHLAALLKEELGRVIRPEEYMMPQPPLKPLPIAAIAVEKPEWGGHKRSDLQPISSVPFGKEKLGDEEIIIIGSGIAGCSTAYWLGKEGKSALVLDRGPVNGQASGGNAGSMHVQLLSFDFGTKAEGGGSPALMTLPLQLASSKIWNQLQDELKEDFEVKTVGGLMMAETEEHLKFLQDKTERERSVGIECHVIGRDELQKMAPYISPLMAGAAFCPEEGKVNPLKGTQGVFRAARAMGQRFESGVEVLHIEKNDKGFRIDTPKGWYQAKVVVNCAGAWASQISAMVGNAIPVYGAPLQMNVTEAVKPTVNYLLAHADRHLTMKQMHNGNFVIGGGWTAGYSETTRYPTTLRDSLEGNAWVARRVIPALDGVHYIRSWAAMNINID
ncbi:FAD-dependent oxidoreductase, partial [Desulfovibrio sp. OttesenSCG-928-I05]|nr:FAD-dependent oxidoreductase [Desulfovibrio sp. OttesenSCG-928-I05]